MSTQIFSELDLRPTIGTKSHRKTYLRFGQLLNEIE